MNKFSYTVVCMVAVVFSMAVANFCPGHRIRCQKDQTCCSDNQGGYGCCPYQNATCCTDGLHCCPEDTVCDLPHGSCKPKRAEVHLLEKLLPSEDITSVAPGELDDNELNAGFFFFQKAAGGKQTCPDGKRTCASAYTCCAEQGGSYACCPFKDGVCCSDFTHCCPQFQKCNITRGSCDKI